VTSGQQVAVGVAIVAALVALIAVAGDWRQKRRRDLDRVSLLDWRTVQLAALVIAIAAVAFALHAG
jgi:hypothetical protein